MTEKYLHFIWKNKRLPFHLLKTTEGKTIRIVNVGTYNTASGPDFFNGQIELDNVVYNGNIELHIKSSDWIAHKHQFDAAYDNVILHVVYEHDQLIFIEGIPLPTLELKHYIDWKHFHQLNDFTVAKNTLPCAAQLEICPEPIKWNQVENALFERLNRKAKELTTGLPLHAVNPKNCLFQALAAAFGMKTNALPFRELANRLPMERFIAASSDQKMALVFGASGLLNPTPSDTYEAQLLREWEFQRAKLHVSSLQKASWQFKGCRPSGFPTLRLAQFAQFIDKMDWSSAFWELPISEIKNLLYQQLCASISDEYWKKHYHFGKEKQRANSGVMSPETATVIIINSIVPYLWWLSDFTSNSVYREQSLSLLESMPPEKNQYISDWKDHGFIPKSAADSQGLLELTHQWCAKKNCLKCRIGQYILNQKV